MVQAEILAAIVAAVAAEEGGPVRVVQVRPVGTGLAAAGNAAWAWAGRQELMAGRTQVLARPHGRRGATGAGLGDGRGRPEPKARRRAGGGRRT